MKRNLPNLTLNSPKFRLLRFGEMRIGNSSDSWERLFSIGIRFWCLLMPLRERGINAIPEALADMLADHYELTLRQQAEKNRMI